MKRLLLLIVMLLPAMPAAASDNDDLLDWLEQIADPHSEELEHDGADLLTLEPGETEMFPKVSPDGRTMLVVSGKHRDRALTLRMVENGDSMGEVSDDAAALSSVQWRDAEHVVFLSSRSGDPGLWEMPVDRRGPVRRLARLSVNYVQPLLLADGAVIAVGLEPVKPGHHEPDLLAFDNWKSLGKEPHILRVNANGAEEVLANGADPALSPDGEQVVFSMPAGKDWHLYMMRADGSDLIQLTSDHSIDAQPTWSPDGRWIAFVSNRAGGEKRMNSRRNWDVWAIRSDGRSLTRLTTNEGDDGAPSIAANGRVYFHSDRKVERENRKDHRLVGSTQGFHIWSVALPDHK